MVQQTPDWSPAVISKIRKMSHDGLSIAEAQSAIGTGIKLEAFRSRCQRLGITFKARRSAHAGTSKLTDSERPDTPPEWDAATIRAMRALSRSGATAKQARDQLPYFILDTTFARRCRQNGIIFARISAHNGTSKAVQPQGEEDAR